MTTTSVFTLGASALAGDVARLTQWATTRADDGRHADGLRHLLRRDAGIGYAEEYEDRPLLIA
jgi:hypothetical protein